MLMKLGENLDCHIRPRELVGVVLDLLTTEQRFEPTDTPLQLTDRGACVGRGNENVDNHDALQAARPLDRLGNMGGSSDGSLSGRVSDEAGVPAQSLLGSLGEICEIATRVRPRSSGRKMPLAIVKQQQAGNCPRNHSALDAQPGATEFICMARLEKRLPDPGINLRSR